jgi:SAM-dependent methyltransferase
MIETESRRSPYIIHGGSLGRERLRVLTAAVQPMTLALLDEAGIPPGARCLDVGCGGGDVTLELAARVGADGDVIGIDRDAEAIEIARTEARAAGADVDYLVVDLLRDEIGSGFDVVFVRFVLTHLAEPERACERLLAAARPGGSVIVEDVDVSGGFCDPPDPAYDRFLEIFRAAARRRGADPDIGRRLPRLLRDAGLADVRVRSGQPVGMRTDGAEGAAKLVMPLTAASIRAAATQEGIAGKDELADLTVRLQELAGDPGVVMSMPRIVQAWGRRP